ncbi:MAG: ParB/RepB/Spo0J family partition protein [Gammaproteobacteria bacterium]|jgi:ParB family chromosome partitioning protein
MTRKKPGLGRGLDVLLSSAAEVRETADDSDLRHIPVEHIRRGKYQPRVHIRPEALQELADSIRAQGLVQPVVVRRVGDGEFELIAGERRWRAAQMAGLLEVPAVVRDIPDQAAAAMSLIENIQREDLNPLEEANALQRLINEFGLTHMQTAEAVGRSRTAVTNLLRLLDLSDEVKAMVDEGQLEMGHARALLALQGRAQLEAARHVAARGLSVRQTEQYIKSLQHPKSRPARPQSADPDVKRLEQRVSEQLGAKVQLAHGGDGKGRLVIHYNSLDELDGILQHIK